MCVAVVVLCLVGQFKNIKYKSHERKGESIPEKMEQNTANIITPWEVNLKIMIMKKFPIQLNI